MYESRRQPVIPREHFLRRLRRHVLPAAGFLAGSLGAGKFFAGGYAPYSGLFFLVIAAIVFAPVLHRLLHMFHWNERP